MDDLMNLSWDKKQPSQPSSQTFQQNNASFGTNPKLSSQPVMSTMNKPNQSPMISGMYTSGPASNGWASPMMNGTATSNTPSASTKKGKNVFMLVDAFDSLVSFGSNNNDKVDFSKMSLADQAKYKQSQQNTLKQPLSKPASVSNTPIANTPSPEQRNFNNINATSIPNSSFTSNSAPKSNNDAFAGLLGNMITSKPDPSLGSMNTSKVTSNLTSPSNNSIINSGTSTPKVNPVNDWNFDLLTQPVQMNISPQKSSQSNISVSQSNIAPANDLFGIQKNAPANDLLGNQKNANDFDPFGIFGQAPSKTAAPSVANGPSGTSGSASTLASSNAPTLSSAPITKNLIPAADTPVVTNVSSTGVSSSNVPVQSTQKTSNQSQPNVSMDKNIAKLMDIGFSANDAKAALQSNNNDLEKSVAYLLSKSSPPKQSSTQPESKNQDRFAMASNFGASLFSKVTKIVADGTKTIQAKIEQRNNRVNGSDESLEEYNRPSKGISNRYGTNDNGWEDDQPSMNNPATFQSSKIDKPAAPTQAPKPVKPKRNVPLVSATQEQISKAEKYRESGTLFFKQGQYGDAEAQYTLAIESIPVEHLALIPLMNNRAAARLKTGNYKECIEETTAVERMCKAELVFEDASYYVCSTVPNGIGSITSGEPAVVELKDAVTKALLRRANAYENIEKYENALEDYRNVIAWNPAAKGANEGMRRCTKAVDQKKNGVSEPDRPVNGHVPEVSKELAFDPFQQPSKSKSTQGGMSDLDFLAAPAANVTPAASDGFKSERVEALKAQDKIQEKEDAEKLRLKDSIDAKIISWKGGKEKNIRALLSSVDTILWAEIKGDWKPVNLSELITPQQVKVRYMKTIAKFHPDKLSNMTLTVEQKLIANAVFGSLNDAWDAFKVQNNL